jgi:hypothetical protein
MFVDITFRIHRVLDDRPASIGEASRKRNIRTERNRRQNRHERGELKTQRGGVEPLAPPLRDTHYDATTGPASHGRSKRHSDHDLNVRRERILPGPAQHASEEPISSPLWDESSNVQPPHHKNWS